MEGVADFGWGRGEREWVCDDDVRKLFEIFSRKFLALSRRRARSSKVYPTPLLSLTLPCHSFVLPLAPAPVHYKFSTCCSCYFLLPACVVCYLLNGLPVLPAVFFPSSLRCSPALWSSVLQLSFFIPLNLSPPVCVAPRPKSVFSETSASLRSAATGCHFTADNATSDIVPPSRPPCSSPDLLPPHHLCIPKPRSLAVAPSSSSSSSS